MLIIKVEKKENIERALKSLKGKVIKTKQTQILSKRKEFEKKSVTRRNQIKKAIYIEKKKKSD